MCLASLGDKEERVSSTFWCGGKKEREEEVGKPWWRNHADACP